jgi:hypothetical protein
MYKLPRHLHISFDVPPDVCLAQNVSNHCATSDRDSRFVCLRGAHLVSEVSTRGWPLCLCTSRAVCTRVLLLPRPSLSVCLSCLGRLVRPWAEASAGKFPQRERQATHTPERWRLRTRERRDQRCKHPRGIWWWARSCSIAHWAQRSEERGVRAATSTRGMWEEGPRAE